MREAALCKLQLLAFACMLLGAGTTEDTMDMLGHYIKHRRSLARACLLINGGHGIKDIDRYVIGLLVDSRLPFFVSMV